MLCAPPPIMTSASPRRRISVASPIACVLAAQAVRQFIAGPRGAGEKCQMRQRHVRLLLQFAHDIHPLIRDLRPFDRIDACSSRFSMPSARRRYKRQNQANLRRCRDKSPRGRDRACFDPDPPPSMPAGNAQGELRIPPRPGVLARIADEIGETIILHLRRDAGGKRRRVEDRRLRNPGFARPPDASRPIRWNAPSA